MEIKPFNEPIYVTRPILPDLNDFHDKLQDIWRLKRITNFGRQHDELTIRLTKYLGKRKKILFNNGTTALIAAIKSLNLEGEVITTPFTFPATIHALSWNNLEPVFCDIDKKTMNLDPNNIERLISGKTSAILGVHLFGNPCDVIKIKQIADKYNLKVIYDASHAFGVKYYKKNIACYGDISIFSFHATKLFHTVEGGVVATGDENLKHNCELLRNFGLKQTENITLPGINGKLNEIQAALGLLVLKYIDDEIEKRKRLTKIYLKLLKGVEGIDFQEKDAMSQDNYQYFVIKVNKTKFGLSRNEAFDNFKKYNIFPSKYFYPLCSTYPHYKNLKSSKPQYLKEAHKAADEVLAMPLYGELSEDDIYRICSILISFRK